MGVLQISSYLPAVLGYGFFCQIGQALLFRELFAIFQGNELSFGIILSVWLFWAGVGSRWMSRRIDRVTTFSIFPYALTVSLLLPLTVWGIRFTRGFLPIPPGGLLSILDILWISFLCMGPLCFLQGTLFVRIARAWRVAEQGLDTRIGSKTYIAESVGTALGGLGFSLLLVRWLNPSQLAVFAGTLFTASVLWVGEPAFSGTPAYLGPGKLNLQRLHKLLLLPLGAGLMILAGLIDALTFQAQWRLHAPDYRILLTRQSRYGTLTLAKREDQFSVYQSGYLLFTMASAHSPERGLEEQPALQLAHAALTQHPDPRRVLLVGGGLRGTLRAVLSHPVIQVDYVELDPDLVELAMPFAPEETAQALADPRVNLRIGDGRLYLLYTPSSYDVILLDLPEPVTAAINRFYTAEFFSLASSKLTTNGVLVLKSGSTPELRGIAVANRNATLYHTLKTVFPQVFAAGEQALYYFASPSKDSLSHDGALLARRYQKQIHKTEDLSPRFFELLFLEGPFLRVNWILNRHGRSPDSAFLPPERGPLRIPPLEQQAYDPSLQGPLQERYFINSDFRPIAYFHSLHLWSSLTRADQSHLLAAFLHVKPHWILGIFVLPLIIPVWFRVRRPARLRPLRWALWFCVFTTGLSTMSMQVALLFAFQTQYGFVYEMVGFIIALFMIGLAAGTSLTHVWVRDKTDLRILALLQLLLGTFAGIIGLGLPALSGSPLLVFLSFSLLTLGSGILNGADFPLSSACFSKLQNRVDPAVGTVYGVELWGACVGCLSAGLVVAPILGLVYCFYLASLANLTAFVILWILRKEGHVYG